MAGRDVFALNHSQLNPFLFAIVGTEPSGSQLTMLSLLARLDADPWAVAGGWAKLSPRAAIDAVMEAMTRMPLANAATVDAGSAHAQPVDPRTAAERLVALLPARAPVVPPVVAPATDWHLPKWTPFAMLYGCLVAGIALNMLRMPHLTEGAVVTGALPAALTSSVANAPKELRATHPTPMR